MDCRQSFINLRATKTITNHYIHTIMKTKKTDNYFAPQSYEIEVLTAQSPICASEVTETATGIQDFELEEW